MPPRRSGGPAYSVAPPRPGLRPAASARWPAIGGADRCAAAARRPAVPSSATNPVSTSQVVVVAEQVGEVGRGVGRRASAPWATASRRSRSWYQRSLTRLRQSWSSSSVGSSPRSAKRVRPRPYWRRRPGPEGVPAVGLGRRPDAASRASAGGGGRRACAADAGRATRRSAAASASVGASRRAEPVERRAGAASSPSAAGRRSAGRRSPPGRRRHAGREIDRATSRRSALATRTTRGPSWARAEPQQRAGLLDPLAGVVDGLGVGTAGRRRSAMAPSSCSARLPADLVGDRLGGVDAVGHASMVSQESARASPAGARLLGEARIAVDVVDRRRRRW